MTKPSLVDNLRLLKELWPRHVTINLSKAIAVCFVGLLALAAGLQAAAKIKIDGSEFDFGMVIPNSTVVHHVWLHSTGEDTLTVTGVKTGCACVAVTEPDTTLEGLRLGPGDSLRVSFAWQTRQFITDTHRTIYLLTNAGPEPSRIELSASRMIPTSAGSPVKCRPVTLDFGASDAFEQRFVLTNDTDETMVVECISPIEETYSLALPDTLEARGSVVGTVRLAEAVAGQDIEESITLGFKRPEQSVYIITLPISHGDFSFRPTNTTIK